MKKRGKEGSTGNVGGGGALDFAMLTTKRNGDRKTANRLPCALKHECSRFSLSFFSPWFCFHAPGQPSPSMNTKARGEAQKIHLGLHRSDYMLHRPTKDQPMRFKQATTFPLALVTLSVRRGGTPLSSS